MLALVLSLTAIVLWCVGYYLKIDKPWRYRVENTKEAKDWMDKIEDGKKK